MSGTKRGDGGGFGGVWHQEGESAESFTAEQEDLIRATCCGGASKADADVLISIAEARGLNPILGECCFVERWDNAAGKKRWAVQASIDLRIKAEQTGSTPARTSPSTSTTTTARLRWLA